MPRVTACRRPSRQTRGGQRIEGGNHGSGTFDDEAPGATGTHATGDGPFGVAFDGTSVWITNLFDDTVSKMNPAAGSGPPGATGAGGARGYSSWDVIPSGKVCIYKISSSGVDVSTFAGYRAELAAHGFFAEWSPTAANGSDAFLFATWAYTAP